MKNSACALRPSRRLFGGVLLLSAAVCVAAEKSEVTPEASRVVGVVIDYGDGCQKHFTAIAFKEPMTVLDAMLAARAHPRGIELEYRGKGATAMLLRIDDLTNEGSGRNWIFRVNGKLADRAMGVYQLKPGDAILWKFEKYR